MTDTTAPDPREVLREWDHRDFMSYPTSEKLAAALRVTLTELKSLETEGSARQRIRFAQENERLKAELESLRGDIERGLKPTLAATIAARDALAAELERLRSQLDHQTRRGSHD